MSATLEKGVNLPEDVLLTSALIPRDTSSSPETSEKDAVARRKNAFREGNDVLLRLLLVSGNRSDFSCPLCFSVHQVKQKVLQSWPKEWQNEEKAESINRLKILYHGRFLEDEITLEKLNLPKEEFITMHLLIRPRPTSDPTLRSPKSTKARTMTNSNGTCCGCLQM